jgi:hypothetical protein
MDDTEAPNWDLDSDEIASVASEELYGNRPNRWKGPKSTWRHFTTEERLLWRSMRQIDGKDLAVHLYNAFALKRQGRDPATAQGLTVKTVCCVACLDQLDRWASCSGEWISADNHPRTTGKILSGHRQKPGRRGH